MKIDVMVVGNCLGGKEAGHADRLVLSWVGGEGDWLLHIVIGGSAWHRDEEHWERPDGCKEWWRVGNLKFQVC